MVVQSKSGVGDLPPWDPYATGQVMTGHLPPPWFFFLVFWSGLLVGQKSEVAQGGLFCLTESPREKSLPCWRLRELPGLNSPPKVLPLVFPEYCLQVTQFPWKGKLYVSGQSQMCLFFGGAQQAGVWHCRASAWLKFHGKAPCKWTLQFHWFMAQIRALGASSPVLLLFLVSLETKKSKVPLNIIYWANTEIGELLVNSSVFVLHCLTPWWLQEVETISFCKRSRKTGPSVRSGCFCTSKAKGKLFHWSEQHQAHSHLQHWSALKYN